MTMAIDVIMPVRNGSPWIAQALNSVLADSAVLGRIIVIDDGSTDDTVAIVRSLAGQGRIELLQQPASGLVQALNRGLRAATAPLVARMDADDVSMPGRFQAQARFLAENPDIEVVGTQVCYIDEAGRDLADRTRYPSAPVPITQALFSGRCLLSHPSVAMRRDTVLALGGYRHGFEAAEDYDLWLRVAEKGRIANLPQTFLRYRRHRGQIGAVKKLRQGYSRDLALLCSMERRKGRPDPLAEAGASPLYDPGTEAFRGAPGIFAALARGYRALACLDGLGGPLQTADLAVLPRLASFNLLGEGRRTRRDIMRKVVWAALARSQWLTAAHAARMLTVRTRKPVEWGEIRW